MDSAKRKVKTALRFRKRPNDTENALIQSAPTSLIRNPPCSVSKPGIDTTVVDPPGAVEAARETSRPGPTSESLPKPQAQAAVPEAAGKHIAFSESTDTEKLLLRPLQTKN